MGVKWDRGEARRRPPSAVRPFGASVSDAGRERALFVGGGAGVGGGGGSGGGGSGGGGRPAADGASSVVRGSQRMRAKIPVQVDSGLRIVGEQGMRGKGDGIM